jgi:hypothetical protein
MKNLEFLKYCDQCKTIDERNFVEDVAFGNITLRSNIDILKRIKKSNIERIKLPMNKVILKQLAIEEFVLKFKIIPSKILYKKLVNEIVLKHISLKELLAFNEEYSEYDDDILLQKLDLAVDKPTLKANPSTSTHYPNVCRLLQDILK